MRVIPPAGSCVLVCALVAACSHGQQHVAAPQAATTAPSKQVTLAVLPAESDAFPKTAQAANESLAQARVTGVNATIQSKVSLEVVQLSIECVQATAACYEAVGKSLAADRLLFAQIAPQQQKRVKVTVTLFDVGAQSSIASAEKTFTSEKDAAAGVSALVGEATGGGTMPVVLGGGVKTATAGGAR